MKKAIYKTNNQKVIILSEADEYVEIFIDGEELNVPFSDIFTSLIPNYLIFEKV